jgi:uncharacterized damage-inducible protein DinB
MLKQYRVMAAYNKQMNQQFFSACAELRSEQLKEDRGVFFGSLHSTLNHLLLVDRIWLGGFTDNPMPFGGLDEELYAGFSELRVEREKTDADIEAWAATLTQEKLDSPFSEQLNFPTWLAVTHFFNHQTHHRGQLSALLSQCDLDYGVTDIPWVPGIADLASA